MDKIKTDIQNFWALMYMFAWMQTLMPDWALPETPRQEIRTGTETWFLAIAEIVDYEVDWETGHVPVASKIMGEQYTIEVDSHSFVIDIGGRLDGMYKFGLGHEWKAGPDGHIVYWIEDRFDIANWMKPL